MALASCRPVEFLDYTSQMRALRADFESAVKSFLANYSAFVDNSRIRLNGLFNESDYPSASEIRTRFAFAVRVLPMPDARDFRIELADGQADAIRAEIEASTKAALNSAMRDAWQRIADNVGRMVERLTAFKPGEKGTRAEGIFRDSLVENVRELVALLPTFNLTDDAALAAVAARMESELCQHSAEELREVRGAPHRHCGVGEGNPS